MTGDTRQRKIRIRRTLIVAAFGIALVLFMWQGARLAREQALTELRHAAGNALQLSRANLIGYLTRHDYLPHLLATRESVRRFLARDERTRDTLTLNQLLDRSRAYADVSDIYLLDRDGTTIAASNWQRTDSFMGQNYAFRGYYRQAINGRSGRFHALGTQSGARGYYFSAPVRAIGHASNTPPDGVMVVKVGLDEIEREWQSLDATLLVADINGIIFMSSDPALRLTAFQPLSKSARKGLLSTRRYTDEPLPESGLRVLETLPDGARHVRLGDQDYLNLSQPLARFNWSLHILQPMRPIVRAQWLGALAAGGSWMLIALGSAIGWQRYRLRRERERFAERERQTLAHARDELERHVDARTRELVASNHHLSQEIEERKRAEQTLRQTRDELVQAARLAVLGQLAASINHELNQPLGAIRAYADNARILLARQRVDDADTNLAQISELVERMAAISAQLRQFSRKGGETLTDVSAQACFDYALRLFHARLEASEIRIVSQMSEPACWVRADPVRLEQVLVNLIGNAQQAMSDSTERQLILTVKQQDEWVVLSVADSGPGLSEEAMDYLFEPFYTTRAAGKGLGLGLSISQRIISDLGGRLEACNRPEGGALFMIHLPAATSSNAPLPEGPADA
ncbi:two-component system, NtrC family, C4-dicarboxylate transport sensor histidine kinase DctB [Kushneria avicenniae]|uniref:C4-dicarboxylate transport sensor protein DctB n=1 Tax=Kushneria avicenniae TaxID=402385 RepID=A0A1I1HWH2_9GAMM|nr:ATP-binding protein [Kushneria avicenniae]SFC25793.1 two-component system, NtrC family, C4-dicarboxylate transport sensor histidine kinase DctB [Kushneria avicenniae]